MEGDGRPSKKRKLSNDEDLEPKQVNDAAGKTETENDSLRNGNHVDPKGQSQDDVQLVSGHTNSKSDQDKCAETDSNVPSRSSLPPPDSTAPIIDSVDSNDRGPPLSKNQRKKLQKKLDWESKRDERKVIRKQKLVAKRERKRAARGQALENGEQPLQPPPERPISTLLPVTILIDCDFDDLMRDPERKSLAAQITRSYSDNRKAPFRSHLAVCSFGGELKKRFDNVLDHYKSWKGIRFLPDDFVEAAAQATDWMADPDRGGKMAGVFSKHAPSTAGDPAAACKLFDEGEIVYLTSESDETLTELKPRSTYIIGGLVDKNREKGICYKRATEAGIKTARLPIGEFMDMQSRKVLATNHVNEIMVRWLECGDWGEAFMKVIPKRKGGKLKQIADQGGEDDGEEEDENEDDGADGVNDDLAEVEDERSS